MIRTPLFIILFISSCFVGSLFAHSGHQHEREIENLTFVGDVIESEVLFKISLPYTILFKDEIPKVIYGLKNTSDSPFNAGSELLVTKKQRYYDPNPQSRTWFQLSDGESLEVDTNKYVGRDWNVIKSDFDESDILSPDAWVVKISDYRQGFSQYYEDGYDQLRSLLMVGEKEYIASNWVNIEVLDETIAFGSEKSKLDYGSEIGYKAPLYVKTLNDERWIFIHRNRVAKIPDGATPRFEMDKETSILTIHFDGTDYEPVVHNVRMIRTLSGPRELIPHFYAVEDMEAELAAIDSTTSHEPEAIEIIPKDSIPEPAIEEPAKLGTAEPTDGPIEKSSNWLLWLIGAVVVVGGTALVVRRKS